MPIPTRAELKTLFETGDIPSQDDFATFIDAVYDLAQGANDAADAAAADAAAALAAVEARAARCFLKLKTVASIPGGTFEWSVDNVVGAAIVLSGTKKSTVTITFDEDLGDTKYTVLPFSENAAAPTITARTSATLVVTLDNAPGADDLFNLAVFR